MTFTGAQLFDLAEPLWFCLQTQPKRERVAAAALRRLAELEVVAPRIRFRKATRRGPVWFVEAMFPGYVFARFLYAAQHRHIQSLPGISKVVCFGDGIAVIEASAVEQLRAAAGEAEEVVYAPLLEVGDAVKIAEGAFSGLEGVITQLLPARERVKVLLEFLGREVVAELASPQLLSTLAPRAVVAGR